MELLVRKTDFKDTVGLLNPTINPVSKKFGFCFSCVIII